MARQRIILFALIFFSVLAGFFFVPQDQFFFLPYSSFTKKPNAAIVILVSPDRIQQVTVALRNIHDRFNHRLQYPIYLFLPSSELSSISSSDIAKIKHVTNGRAELTEIPQKDWDPPTWLDQEKMKAGMDTIGFSTGYRSMCRWYATAFWNHPKLVKYEWIWRLDTDIEFWCDLQDDPIQRVIDRGGLYGFVQISLDSEWVQPTLASNISHFLSQNRHLIHDHQHNLPFTWTDTAKALEGKAGNEEWTRRCMYNNFEIAHRSVYASPLNTALASYLESQGGFFYERWSDSPIRAFSIAMQLRKDQVVHMSDIGYQHQGWEFHCPHTKPECTCEPDSETKWGKEEWSENTGLWYEA